MQHYQLIYGKLSIKLVLITFYFHQVSHIMISNVKLDSTKFDQKNIIDTNK